MVNPGNIHSIGSVGAFANLTDAISKAFLAGCVPEETVACACLGLAGAGRAAEKKRILEWAISKHVASDALVSGDTELLLAANGGLDIPATGQETGLCLVSGTGSMCWGRNELGETDRSGGWGPLMGDEGSGYSIGRLGLRLACETADGRANEVELLDCILGYLGLDETDQLIEWCYEAADTRARVASISPLLFEQYSSSGRVRECIKAEATSLAKMVAAVAKNLKMDNVGI